MREAAGGRELSRALTLGRYTAARPGSDLSGSVAVSSFSSAIRFPRSDQFAERRHSPHPLDALDTILARRPHAEVARSLMGIAA